MTRWALLTAERSADHAAHLARIVERLAAEGVRTAGFLQVKLVSPDGAKRYELVRVGGGDERVLLAAEGLPAEGLPAETTTAPESFSCALRFRDAAFATAAGWLSADADAADLLVVGGIGRLELHGQGHAPALAAALGRGLAPVLLGVRASRLGAVIDRFGLDEGDLVAALEEPAGAAAFEAFIAGLVLACRRR